MRMGGEEGRKNGREKILKDFPLSFQLVSNLLGNVTEKERIRILSSLNSKFPI